MCWNKIEVPEQDRGAKIAAGIGARCQWRIEVLQLYQGVEVVSRSVNRIQNKIEVREQDP